MRDAFESETFHQAVKTAIARSILKEMAPDAHDEILAEVRKELLASCRDEALVRARQEMADELQGQRERSADGLARDRAQYQPEADASIEVGIAKVLRQQQEDWTLEIQHARTQRNAARQERDQAVALLADLAKQVFGPSPTKSTRTRAA